MLRKETWARIIICSHQNTDVHKSMGKAKFAQRIFQVGRQDSLKGKHGHFKTWQSKKDH